MKKVFAFQLMHKISALSLMSGDKSCHAVQWAASWLMQRFKSALPWARANITAALSSCRPRLPACKDFLHLTFHPPKLLLSKCLFLFLPSHFYHSDIPSVLHSLHIPGSLWDKSRLLFHPAYLAARQIAPLASKRPQQKDNDKGTVSQLSFPQSAPAFHITVIDCNVSWSAIVPQDTQESCQEL